MWNKSSICNNYSEITYIMKINTGVTKYFKRAEQYTIHNMLNESPYWLLSVVQ